MLLFSSIRFLLPSKASTEVPKPPELLIALLSGALLGYLAGLTGTGGGIFLACHDRHHPSALDLPRA